MARSTHRKGSTLLDVLCAAAGIAAGLSPVAVIGSLVGCGSATPAAPTPSSPATVVSSGVTTPEPTQGQSEGFPVPPPAPEPTPVATGSSGPVVLPVGPIMVKYGGPRH